MPRQKYIPHYTVSDYNLWDGNWELIDGVPCAMSPSPVRRHQSFSAILTRQIGNNLDAQNETCGTCEVVSETDWIVNESTVLRPDITIVYEWTTDYITKPPVLIVEILSPSTAINDSHVKFEIYQEQGVKYYIIANTATKTWQSYILQGTIYVEQEFASVDVHEGCTIAIDLHKAMAAIKD